KGRYNTRPPQVRLDAPLRSRPQRARRRDVLFAYVESPSDARTKLEAFFNILVSRSRRPCHSTDDLPDSPHAPSRPAQAKRPARSTGGTSPSCTRLSSPDADGTARRARTARDSRSSHRPESSADR